MGTRQYLDELEAQRNVDGLYADALAALVTMQTFAALRRRAVCRPTTAALLLREMELMPEWFLGRHLGCEPAAGDRELLDRSFEALIASALAQPATFVHRDYHSRNLLITDERNPGILDFQDAVSGPVTYDAVSLLKDCYIAWPPRAGAGVAAGLPRDVDAGRVCAGRR